MGFINIFVGSESFIKLKNNQLQLTKLDGEFIDYPIEDINSVLIENQQSIISVQCLNKLVENNVIVYLCNSKHLPSAYVLGYNSFYKNLEIYQLQVDAPKPLQKQIWKSVVEQKITNQIEVLNILNIKNDLFQYLTQIRSGDTSNIEGVVANKYFKLLFGPAFARREDCLINSALNYGYAIIRGAIARSVVAHGLQPFMGIHHINKLNNFNLVDDLIEPFRPIVDLFVYKNVANTQEQDLTPSLKLFLHRLLVNDIKIQGGNYNVSDAIDIMVSSYVSCLKNKECKFKMPTIINLKVHEYE